MWDYYKRTFVLVQLAALPVCYLAYRNSNRWLAPVACFLSMQLASVFGAMWANRLRRKVLAAQRRQAW